MFYYEGYGISHFFCDSGGGAATATNEAFEGKSSDLERVCGRGFSKAILRSCINSHHPGLVEKLRFPIRQGHDDAHWQAA